VYVNSVNDRKQLGYKVVKDTNCGIELVLMTKLTVRLIRNLPLNSKVKSKRIIVVSTLVSTLWFSNVQPYPAMGLSIPAAPVVRIHQVTYSYNESTRQVAGFNKETGELITAGKYSPRAFNRFLDTMHLGRL
jgi:hypothetical protein